MRNIKLIASYDGTAFFGWQCQLTKRTVAGTIQDAIKRLTGEDITLTAAGRTDAGVHAVGQCANFRTSSSIGSERFKRALNSFLPPDVRILSSSEAPLDFSSRFNALSRTYKYFFICGLSLLPHERLYALHLPHTPDIDLLNSYTEFLKGETDCSLFASSKDLIFKRGSGSKFRFIKKAHFYFEDEAEKRKLIFEISANAFFQKMVRSIVGTLLFYESKKTPPDEFQKILLEGDRKKAGTTIEPTGLFLWSVEY